MAKYALSWIAALLLVVWVGSPGAAEKVVGMSKKVYDAINEVQLLFDADNYDEALLQLKAIQKKKLSSYETAHILNMIGYVYYQKDQLPAALAAYNEALAQPDLPDSQVRTILITAAQVSLVADKYKEAEALARRLIASPGKKPPPPMSHIILAQALISQERYEEAKEPILKAINDQREAGKLPRENWLALLSAVYFNMEDYESMRNVLYEMVTLYPKEQYLINLAALHGQLGETDKQLALVESLLDDDRLAKGHHLLNLANLFLAHKLPYKAATLLEQEMKAERIEVNKRNLELLSQSWYLAGEQRKAIPPLERAGSLADDGELYLRAARLYMDIYDWENAEAAARAAVKHGGLREPGNAWLLQGMALAKREQFKPARKMFRKAADFDETEKWARQWIKFIDGEERRIAALQ
jgi:tetratricopeptide (TPR) repeat protein